MVKLLPIITALSLCALGDATFNISNKAGYIPSCSGTVQQCPGRCDSSCVWPDILCPQSYMPTCPGDCPKKAIPCPDDCKTSCLYPLNARCPYQQKPKCPDGPIQNIFCPDIIIPCPDECPHSCKYDTSLPCPYAAIPQCVGKVQKCPKIKVPCPKKCPGNCVYPDKPCPFKYEPKCPEDLGSSHKPNPEDKCKGHICPLSNKLCPKECSTSCKFKDPVDECCPESGTPYCPNESGKDKDDCAKVVCPLVNKLCPKECSTTCKFKDSPNKCCPELGTPYCP